MLGSLNVLGSDPLSHSTVYGYDSAGRLQTVTDPLSRITTYAYDAENRRTVVTDSDIEGPLVPATDVNLIYQKFGFSVRASSSFARTCSGDM